MFLAILCVRISRVRLFWDMSRFFQGHRQTSGASCSLMLRHFIVAADAIFSHTVGNRRRCNRLVELDDVALSLAGL